jgi:rhodanese-related sulfurtransferase
MNETAEFVIRLLVSGALARSGHPSTAPTVFFGVLACLIADGAWFQIARSRGAKVLGFLCRMALEPACVRQMENRFARYGLRFLLVAKFIPGMNAVAAPLAGSSRVGWGLFLLFDALDVVVLDVGGGLSTKDGPIPGAVRIPLSELAARHREIPRDRDVVLYCNFPNEASSARAALLLKKHGIARVRPLEGGADAWLELTGSGKQH